MDRAIDEHQENERILLDLLKSVEHDGERSQRHIAGELGVALGLVNAYLKRCVKKGLIKVQDAPARRYAYYLTPQGFAEKSRLTVQYLSDSFSFFRKAKDDCAHLFAEAAERGFERLVLAGKSDFAEIAILCAVDAGATVVAIVDARDQGSRFVGVDVVGCFSDVKAGFDAIIVTDVARAQDSFELAVAAVGRDRVLVPSLLGLRPQKSAESAA
jgi:predicted transcriptional regulator